MTTKMFGRVRVLLRFVTKCRIYIGRDPESVQAPALILFPLWINRLCCGFAGLLTCRLEDSVEAVDDAVDLSPLWKKVASAPIKEVVDGKIAPQAYLGGRGAVSSFEEAVLFLKRENVQERLFFNPASIESLMRTAADMKAFLAREEAFLEDQGASIASADLEGINGLLLTIKDVQWVLSRDILDNLGKILALCGMQRPEALTGAAFRKYRKLNLLLNALDRLEVRGRDSAGISLSFTIDAQCHFQEVLESLKAEGLAPDYARRVAPGDLLNRSISVSSRGEQVVVSFTYKTFSIVGELGRNVAQLRREIAGDRVLGVFAARESVCETALTHTRWASVGSITEENCHPVNEYRPPSAAHQDDADPGLSGRIHVVLNGDIDNYPALRQAVEHEAVKISPLVSTDTKIIPLQIEKHLLEGNDLARAFRLAVNDFEGSHAIAMHCDLEPNKMFLALKGSGQSIYVGIGKDQYMFSSELYGLVEAMPRFIKMNGEESGGQIFILDQAAGPGLRGLAACTYDGGPIELSDTNIQTAEITTRDIDRGDYPHFFLKEISESALSIKRTLRGKYRIVNPGKPSVRVVFNLGEDMVPGAVCTGIKDGSIDNILIIGHGTAAVAGQAVADALSGYLRGGDLTATARVASELSGFGLRDDLSDTLVIPITQSGTTTDTNRAVAMARERGAQIIAIVNRRQSDITSKSHGVFYTSDGRDIEMSVASTKAFYSQIVAGQILALFFAQLLGVRSDEEIACALNHLEGAPKLMAEVFARREAIAASVKTAIGKKFWAIVGSGPNKAAADEIRIKLSELCYKTISSDVTENKKHIDLSAEPLILVCAAGNPPAVVEDIAKDVAIFKAHKASVVVFADEGDSRFDETADAVIGLPGAPEPLPVILNTMAGHLWGYYAARAIDEEAHLFREFRSRMNSMISDSTLAGGIERIAEPALRRIVNDFYAAFNALRNGGALSALAGKTLGDLVLLLKYAAGKLPLHDIRHDFPGQEGIISLFDLLDTTLGAAIDELTRPIDAIRHQAKTVTVGTSRKERELRGPIFDLLETLHLPTRDLTYRNLVTAGRIQPALRSIRGYTLYDIKGLDDAGNPAEGTSIIVTAKGGVALQMTSRADAGAPLLGTKRTLVSTGHAYIGKGKTDAAPIVILPVLGEGNFVKHLLLLHVEFDERLTTAQKRFVLGYRYNDIRNLVNEYNIPWNDAYLESISLADLFSETVESLAGRIRQASIAGNAP